MKRAIILGGTEDHIRLIELLKEKGYYTYLIDYLENPPAKLVADEHIRESALDKEKVLEIALSLQVQFVIALCIDQPLSIMAYVSEKLGSRCYLTYEMALELTNKAFMKEKMINHGIPTADFFVLDNNILDKDEIDKLNFPLVVKPSDSNSSKGIKKVNSKDDLAKAINTAYQISRSGKVVVEKFTEGDEYSAEFFIENGIPQFIVATKTFKTDIHANKFVICNSMTPSGLSEQNILHLGEIVKKISGAFNLINGPLFIQFLKNKDGLHVIEFSSRIGGGSRHHFVKFSKKFDYLKFLLEFSLGDEVKMKLNNDENYYGCHFIYANEGKMERISGFDGLKEKGLLLDYYLYKSPGSEIKGNDSSSHRPIGYIVKADSYDKLISRAKEIDSSVKILNEHNEDIMIHQLHYKN